MNVAASLIGTNPIIDLILPAVCFGALAVIVWRR